MTCFSPAPRRLQNEAEGYKGHLRALGLQGVCNFGLACLAAGPPTWSERFGKLEPQDGVVKVWDGELQCQDVLQAPQS